MPSLWRTRSTNSNLAHRSQVREQRRVLPSLEARPHLVLPVPRDPTGKTGPTPAETRGPNWLRTSWNRYVPADSVRSIDQLIVEAAARLPANGAITGWAAMHWIGARRWWTGQAPDGLLRPITLAVGGENVRAQAGVAISKERLDPRDVIVVDEVRVTTPVRSVFFEMRYAEDEREAGRLLSMAAYHDRVSIDEMAEYAWQHNGWTGVPQCRDGVALADENCWSPPEFDMLATWCLDAGLPRPLCNRPVFGPDGRHVGTPDLIDTTTGTLGQYDGALHLSGQRRAIDIRQEAAYRDLGLECVTMTAADLADLRGAAQRMRSAWERARQRPPDERQWSTTPPDWWVPTHTVALRRALTPSQRSRLLRYRAA